MICTNSVSKSIQIHGNALESVSGKLFFFLFDFMLNQEGGLQKKSRYLKKMNFFKI